MAEHTLESWHVYNAQPAGGSIAINTSGGKHGNEGVALMNMVNVSREHLKRQLARAHLIAAAPELLEALLSITTRLANIHCSVCGQKYSSTHADCVWGDLLNPAYQAITKAEADAK